MSNQPVPVSRAVAVGAASGAVASVLNYIVFFAAQAAGVVFVADFQQTGTPGPLPIPMIAGSTMAGAVVGSLIYARLSRRPNGQKTFLIVAGTFLVLSLFGPFNVPNIAMSVAIALNVMHVVAGAVIVGGLTRFARA